MINKWSTDYLKNPCPHPNKTIEEIWDDIDSFSFESIYINEKKDQINMVVPIPPFTYEGKYIKGVLFSQAVDYLIECFPNLTKIFFTIANPMWSSIPHSRKADLFFTCYENKKREQYYKNKYPETKNITFLPLQDADWVNEYVMAPSWDTPKDIDVLMITTAFPFKNTPIVAKAIKIYEKLYGEKLKVEWTLGQPELIRHPDGSIDYSKLRFDAQNELKEIDKIFEGKTKDYIDIYPSTGYSDMPKHYTRAKCLVLASLIEGKNRGICEANCCNTPAIIFKDHNKYARCGYPEFLEGCGEYVENFDPECLAKTIRKVIKNYKSYHPRREYLTYKGRKNFVNQLADYIPYYKENIPGYENKNFYNNIWVDMATQADYQISYHDFIYDKNPAISNIKGIENIEKILDFYHSRFEIDFISNVKETNERQN